MRIFALLVAIVTATEGAAVPLTGIFADIEFDSIDGGTLSPGDWAGRPVLVVNTASFCAFTGQYEDLQALFDAHRDAGLVVLAVPSDDFNQEFGTDAEVAEFCDLTYGIDMPMTGITPVRGSDAHPFYRAVRADTGWEPQWNFNKVLIDGTGAVVGTWGSGTRSRSQQIEGRIAALLAGGQAGVRVRAGTRAMPTALP